MYRTSSPSARVRGQPCRRVLQRTAGRTLELGPRGALDALEGQLQAAFEVRELRARTLELGLGVNPLDGRLAVPARGEREALDLRARRRLLLPRGLDAARRVRGRAAGARAAPQAPRAPARGTGVPTVRARGARVPGRSRGCRRSAAGRLAFARSSLSARFSWSARSRAFFASSASRSARSARRFSCVISATRRSWSLGQSREFAPVALELPGRGGSALFSGGQARLDLLLLLVSRGCRRFGGLGGFARRGDLLGGLARTWFASSAADPRSALELLGTKLRLRLGSLDRLRVRFEPVGEPVALLVRDAVRPHQLGVSPFELVVRLLERRHPFLGGGERLRRPLFGFRGPLLSVLGALRGRGGLLLRARERRLGGVALLDRGRQRSLHAGALFARGLKRRIRAGLRLLQGGQTGFADRVQLAAQVRDIGMCRLGALARLRKRRLRVRLDIGHRLRVGPLHVLELSPELCDLRIRGIGLLPRLGERGLRRFRLLPRLGARSLRAVLRLGLSRLHARLGLRDSRLRLLPRLRNSRSRGPPAPAAQPRQPAPAPAGQPPPPAPRPPREHARPAAAPLRRPRPAPPP